MEEALDTSVSRRTSRTRRRRTTPTGLVQPPIGSMRNPYPPMAILSDDEIEAIHNASLSILADIGMDFLHPIAREILRQAGATVSPDSERVRFDPELVTTLVAKAPSSFTMTARNPERSVGIGGNQIVFASVGSPPNVTDTERGRRRGNLEDFENLVRLGQSLDAVQVISGYPVEPVDLSPRTRHLDCLQRFVTLSDKPFHAYSLGRERILDGLKIAAIAHGVDIDELADGPVRLFSVINTSSPLRLDTPMIDGILEMARHNQLVVITPFTLSGAMAPATIPGALAQQNAEALAAIALVQAINPGAPVIYGGFTSNVDMKSGAPAFGTPEYAKAVIIGGQLARRYGLPYRSSNVNASNCVDLQAAYESCNSLWALTLGHANFVMHGAGWLEGGLTASFEKMVLDAELISNIASFLRPITVDADTLALDAVHEVGPGGHYFGAQHTLARYETAFYSPMLSDWRNFGAWEEAGSRDALARANTIYRSLLDSFEPPLLDLSIQEELETFVAKRKEEGGAPVD